MMDRRAFAKLSLLFVAVQDAHAKRLAKGGRVGSPPPPAPEPPPPPPPPAAGQRLAEPLIDWGNTILSGNDQFTLAWLAPTWMADYSSAANTIAGYTVYYGQNRLQVLLGEEGTGTSTAAKTDAQLSHVQGSLAAGAWFACVTANNAAGKSLTSQTVAFTVT